MFKTDFKRIAYLNKIFQMADRKKRFLGDYDIQCPYCKKKDIIVARCDVVTSPAYQRSSNSPLSFKFGSPTDNNPKYQTTIGGYGALKVLRMNRCVYLTAKHNVNLFCLWCNRKITDKCAAIIASRHKEFTERATKRKSRKGFKKIDRRRTFPGTPHNNKSHIGLLP